MEQDDQLDYLTSPATKRLEMPELERGASGTSRTDPDPMISDWLKDDRTVLFVQIQNNDDGRSWL